MNFLKLAKSIVWTIFPPERPVERVIRTQYHRITSTPGYVAHQIKQSAASYNKWLSYQDRMLGAKADPVKTQPLVSFLVSTTSDGDLSCTSESLQKQIGANYEIIPVSQEPVSPKNEAISSLKDACYRAKGKYLVCCGAGDQFDPHFLQQVRQAIEANPQAQIIYTDSDEKNSLSGPTQPFFKPSASSPELLLSINYLSGAAIRKESALKFIEQGNPGFSFFNQERELILHLCEGSNNPVHIPWVLVHQLRPNKPIDAESAQLIRDHLIRCGYPQSVTVDSAPGPRVRWENGSPSVSIIVPTKNSYAVLKNLLTSLFEKTTYENYEVILVDNGSDQKEVLDYYTEITRSHNVRIVPFNEPFNYSRANNLGAANSQAEYLLFLNNDMAVIHPDWLSELVQWASRPEIGIVGAKLLHANRTIQHAGVVLGLQNFVGHLYLNTPEHYHGLIGSVDWYRDVSAVTGACQMMRRSTFIELGGYDEAFTLVFSDVSFCLQALTRGFRVLYTPYACLYHLEGGSRGYKSPRQDMLRGFDVLQEWVIHDDPYFSPNLTYTTLPACQLEYQDNEKRLAVINERRKFLLK